MSGYQRGFLGYSNEEMDQRIAALAARVGIGRGEIVVRHVAAAVKPDVHEEAEEAVLGVLREGRPAAISFLAYRTGLPRSRVATAVRTLVEQGKVVRAGDKRNARARVDRLWELAPSALREAERLDEGA